MSWPGSQSQNNVRQRQATGDTWSRSRADAQRFGRGQRWARGRAKFHRLPLALHGRQRGRGVDRRRHNRDERARARRRRLTLARACAGRHRGLADALDRAQLRSARLRPKLDRVLREHGARHERQHVGVVGVRDGRAAGAVLDEGQRALVVLRLVNWDLAWQRAPADTAAARARALSRTGGRAARQRLKDRSTAGGAQSAEGPTTARHGARRRALHRSACESPPRRQSLH